MAFDIHALYRMKPSEVRKLIREGVIDFPTAGMCRGYASGQPSSSLEWAGDFEDLRGVAFLPHSRDRPWYPETHDMGEERQHCTDIPKTASTATQ